MTAPQSLYPFFHRFPIQTRFTDYDILGHINNTVYLQYMDLGKVQYIGDVLHNEFNFKKESMVIVSLKCDYYSISSFGEPLEVLTRVDSIGESSLVFEQRVINSDSQEVKCIARIVMVGFNIVDGCKIVIPDSWHSVISAFENRPI